MKKFAISMLILAVWILLTNFMFATSTANDVNSALSQFKTGGQEYTTYHWFKTNGYIGGSVTVFVICLILNWSNLMKLRNLLFPIIMVTMFTGCIYRPFEPVQLEAIGTNEEGFLIPYTADGKAQVSTASEEYLKQNLVSVKQVRIPQQWVPNDYEWIFYHGEWKPAAVLIKVDKSPETREWTASKTSGTSDKDEAIWVMTADQVEFSTGWTCTARIESKDDAIKFLYNYPNGSLDSVMDKEIRAYLQSEFALEVTDLDMDEMRKAATPHIVKVIDKVKKFFAPRGITITNLGITGGFVYKNQSVIETMVRVLNAEQDKSIAIAETQAQVEKNKKIQLEAEAKSQAILTVKKAEADGIKAVAEAKAFEIEKAKEDAQTYIMLKNIEINKERVEKWDGKFPTYYIGDSSVEMLLTPPAMTTPK